MLYPGSMNVSFSWQIFRWRSRFNTFISCSRCFHADSISSIRRDGRLRNCCTRSPGKDLIAYHLRSSRWSALTTVANAPLPIPWSMS